MKRILAAGLILYIGLWLGVGVLAQTQVAPAMRACTGTGEMGFGFCSYSPTQLGASAITEPASGTTALTNTIDMRGAKQAALKFSCTQGAITANVQTYAEDGTTALVLFSPVSAVAAATNADLYIGSESTNAVTSGTVATGTIRLPQRALAFSWTNASITAGTCTARLFVGY